MQKYLVDEKEGELKCPDCGAVLKYEIRDRKIVIVGSTHAE